MAKLQIPAKLMTEFDKVVVDGSNALNVLKDIRFRLMRSTRNCITEIVTNELSAILRDNPKNVVLDPDLATIIRRGLALADNPEAFEDFMLDYVPYAAENRPLLDYSNFNNKFRSILREASEAGVSEAANNIKSISLQPKSGLSSQATITYTSNNAARDRDQDFLETFIEKVLSFVPYFEDVRVEGVRVYATINWLPSKATFAASCGEALDDFIYAVEACRAAGVEDIDEGGLTEGVCDALQLSSLVQIDEYSLERFMYLANKQIPITINDVTDKHTGYVRVYAYNGEISSDLLAYISEYLMGTVCTLKDGKLFIQLVGQTRLDKIVSDMIRREGALTFIDSLK